MPVLAARERRRRGERCGTLHNAYDLADRPAFGPREVPPLPVVDSIVVYSSSVYASGLK